jgi:hypothetical protein
MSDTAVSDNEYRREIRSMIDHEDQLRAQRLGWLFTLNGFLFTALGFAWNRSDTWLVAIFAVVGIAAGISALSAMVISNHAVSGLADMVVGGATPAEIGCPGQPNGPLPVMGARRKDYPLRMLVVALYPWRFLPVVLIGAWIAILILRSVTN